MKTRWPQKEGVRLGYTVCHQARKPKRPKPGVPLHLTRTLACELAQHGIQANALWCVVRLMRLFNRRQGEQLAFFTTMATNDVVAPATGFHTLEEHFRMLDAGT